MIEFEPPHPFNKLVAADQQAMRDAIKKSNESGAIMKALELSDKIKNERMGKCM